MKWIQEHANDICTMRPSSILLIHPPVAKPSEPPAGIAKLAGALEANHIAYSLIDANVEGMLFLLQQPPALRDTWTVRASRSLAAHLSDLRSAQLYSNIDRYRRAANDVNRLLVAACRGFDGLPGLCDYHDSHLSPVRSRDLLSSAEHPGSNVFHEYMEKRLRSGIEASGAGLIGISISYLSQALTGFAIAGFIRQNFPKTYIVMGGSLITSWMKNREWPNAFSGLVDLFVAGPGEETLFRLLGLPYDSKQIHPPAYQGFRREDYLSPGFVIPYAASSGCYWARCSFCPERAEGNAYRQIPVAKASDQLVALAAQAKPSLIHLVDNAISPALFKALADHPPGVPWYGFARVTRELTDPDFCRALAKSGCVMLKLGIESGDQKVLDYLDKGTTVEMSSRALITLHSAGIATYVYLLFGTPPETNTEAEKTLSFTASHQAFIDFLNLAIFNLPANAPETAGFTTSDFYGGDCPLYVDFVHPDGWNRREVRRFLDKKFRREPVIASILRNQPPFFTSNHAPFLVMYRAQRARFTRGR